jgi:P4 family phage/plasmid primase-like protien
MAAIDTFLSIVHKHTAMNAVIGLTSIVDTRVQTQWYQQQYIDKLIETALAIGKRANVYIRVTPLAKPPERGRGLERHSLGTSVLWLDYDAYTNALDGVAKLQAMPKPPTMIIYSGKGLHAYWQLDRFYTDLDAIKARNLGLIVALNDGQRDGIADSCYDLARILRVPDTYNIKHSDPILCTIFESNPDRIYRLDDFNAVEFDHNPIEVWDSNPLPVDFLETVKERDAKLAKRILSIEASKKLELPTRSDGQIDRSRNDAYIATRLLGLGYTPEVTMAVLMQPNWLSGSKYQQTHRYDYVLMTVNAAYRAFTRSEDRYFIQKRFQTERLANELNTSNQFIFVAEKLWRYDSGVFLEDGERYIRAETIRRLGSRWTSYASDETLRYVNDQAHVPQETVNQVTEYANVLNGMLHIPTRTLTPHSPAYLSLSQVPAYWQPDVSTEMIDQYMAAVLPADAIPAFWEFFASAFITARYFPKHFMVLVGPGDSGKSKVIELMGRFFGRRNTRAVPFQTLADNKFAAASLYGKMVNLFSDLSQTEATNSDFIKTLTGDDPISGERKFKDWFEFKNTARLAFSANHYPKVKSPDAAYFNRAVIIPCSNHFDRLTADPAIVDKLDTPANRSAILLRLVEGYDRLIAQNSLTECASIAQAGTEYRMLADSVMGFWSACPFDPKASVDKQTAFQIYRQVCHTANKKEVSEDLFFKRTADNLERLGMTTSYDVITSGTTNVDQIRAHRYHGRNVNQGVKTMTIVLSNTPKELN